MASTMRSARAETGGAPPPAPARRPDARRAPPRGGGRGAGGAAPPSPARLVAFPKPLPADAHVAIVGGGVAGLVCALELAALGVRSTVFDTGEHGVGGRLATRAAADGSLRRQPPPPRAAMARFDHAAQYLSPIDPEFAAMAARWEAEGAVRRWDGAVGELLPGGAFRPLPPGAAPRLVGAGGMRALAEHLAARAEATGLSRVERPVWVARARAGAGGWEVVGKGRDAAPTRADALVIAHNGKCANRLMDGVGALAVLAQLQRLKLSATWALAAAFDAPLDDVPWEGAHVRGSDVLAWASDNSRKLRLSAGAPACWTLLSTAAYGKANKCPQEAVPPAVAAKVTAEMLAAFEASLGLPHGALPAPIYARAQLWGASLPLNSPNVRCIWDAQARVGVAGDWVAGGGGVEAAALSGAALARAIAGESGQAVAGAAGRSVGLDARFAPVGADDIGVVLPAAAVPV
jgi:predicted NAD/FAD-dependent oxidoreductase